MLSPTIPLLLLFFAGNAVSADSMPSTTVAPITMTSSLPPFSSTTIGQSTTMEPAQDACKCEYGTIWTDVIVVFQSSASTTPQGLAEMVGFIATYFAFFNVQPTGTDDKFSMRLGTVAYGPSAVLVDPLGSVSDPTNLNPPFLGGASADLHGALSLAVDQFNTTAHRSNARKVILVLSTSYNSNEEQPSLDVSRRFQGDGGVVIIFDYVEGHGLPSPELQAVASSGFFFSSNAAPDGWVLSSMCKANCFCPAGTVSFANDEAGAPTSGCYAVSLPASNYALAKNKCMNIYNGTVAMEKTPEKTSFLTQSFGIRSSYWIGLNKEILLGKWIWADGTYLSADYSPWFKEPSFGADCVYVMNSTWIATECRNIFAYACELLPCDSTRYCQ